MVRIVSASVFLLALCALPAQAQQRAPLPTADGVTAPARPVLPTPQETRLPAMLPPATRDRALRDRVKLERLMPEPLLESRLLERVVEPLSTSDQPSLADQVRRTEDLDAVKQRWDALDRATRIEVEREAAAARRQAAALSLPPWYRAAATAGRSATITVNTLAGDNDGTCGTIPGDPLQDCSLLEAVTLANADLALDVIAFSVAGTIPIAATVTVLTPVEIDGTTAPGGAQQVRIDASGAVNGFLVSGSDASGTVIRGLVIGEAGSTGVVLANGTTGTRVLGNTIGTDPAGTDLGNFTGILVRGGASSNTLGGAGAGEGNTIGFNTYGVYVEDAGTTGNVFLGNTVGTDAAGSDLGNLIGIVVVNSASDNTIGGAGAGEGNLIGFNQDVGVFLASAGTTGNRVLGNHIGTDAAGSNLGNGASGVWIQNAPGNEVGGAGAGNVIGHNGTDGVLVEGAGSTGNVVQGNLVGTNAAGADLGNGRHGVLVFLGASGNTIGGAGAGNTVGFSAEDGIRVQNVGTTGNVVLGNYVGTDAAGSDLGNANAGVLIAFQASDNTIGGAGAGEGNVVGFNGTGIQVQDGGTSGNVVLGNYVGTDAAGSNLGNGTHGVFVNGASDNLIGGAGAGEGNTIGFNQARGIVLQGTGATGNAVLGNHIGTDAAGANLGNGSSGINVIAGASDNLIGGAAAGAGNTIGRNGGSGIFLVDVGTSGNVVLGNTIGTDAAGSNLGNGGSGIIVSDGASDNTIGGAGAGEGNTVGFNSNTGIALQADPGLSTTGNVVLGNYVGTNAAGMNLGSGLVGILVGFGASDNMIGGAGAGEGNTVGFSQQSGIQIQNVGTTGNVVLGNTVGTDAAGTNLGNGVVGILVGFDASGNTIGGAGAGEGNTIGFNFAGILVQDGGTSGNVVLGNYVGTDAGGSDLGNGGGGVWIGLGASGNTIGGAGAGEGNTIGFNNEDGISIQTVGTTGNAVLGNYIGTNAVGSNLGNGRHGVLVWSGASDNTIGGAGAGNTVGFNEFGIVVSGSNPTAGNVVQGNYVGTNAAGDDLGNGAGGVFIGVGASGNTIGGAGAGEGNTIGFNNEDGILIQNVGTTGNVVLGNTVGTNAAGDDLGNGAAGVFIGSGASGNTIGGSAPGEGNTVGFNTLEGVVLQGAGTTGNAVLGNAIFDNGNLGIDHDIDGVTPNDGCADADAGPNGYQNFPVIAAAALDGGTTTVDFDLDTAPGDYRVEFFSVDTPDASGHGEGRTFLGAETVSVAAGCAGTFSAVLGTPAPGSHVTATATLIDGGAPSGFGGTSEFSAAVVVEGDAPPINLTATATSPLTVAPGGQITFDYSVANSTPDPVSGDLYFVATRNGNTVAQGVVRSGTLPGGQTVGGSYTQGVPGIAPLGTYSYAVRIGRFPNVVVDEEVFAVTVANTVAGGEQAAKPQTLKASAGWVVSEAGPWVVVAAEGELADGELAEGASAESEAREGESADTGSMSAASSAVPEAYALRSAYPNPFSDRATVGFDVPEAAHVRLVVYDVLGRAVATLVDGPAEAGRHEAVLDGRGLPSGTYLVRLSTETGFAATQRLTLLR